MLTTLTILAAVFLGAGYLCLCIKIGFTIGDLARNTGFDFGFYMMTVATMVALPFAIFIGFAS